ncbi:hypothetical protein MNEG_9006 [Monoraphidium neglectum]|uniref:Cystatin domain-containing protein n=1 Tax=Monoraphidium neglectum TaxID=145388 RepID=A0A0D2JHX4_9CHLO|nr:hypothetical protein MNEG_9006 [Monoraphidium neglectum]KIY98957.1 hypothetical protein MNEG_9006 [Monoraphidium neglectum]|eukprot:XP_013897977.1 hypothetical protein MNEG_9006 [Monoraphidium neglectum]
MDELSAQGKQVIAVGDFNVAPHQADLYPGAGPLEGCYEGDELAAMRGLMAAYPDAWRRLHPDDCDKFTVWDTKTSARPFNRCPPCREDAPLLWLEPQGDTQGNGYAAADPNAPNLGALTARPLCASASGNATQGCRIDFVMLSPGLLDRLEACEIRYDLPHSWSDHAPVTCDIRLDPPAPQRPPCREWLQLQRRFVDPNQRSIKSMFGARPGRVGAGGRAAGAAASAIAPAAAAAAAAGDGPAASVGAPELGKGPQAHGPVEESARSRSKSEEGAPPAKRRRAGDTVGAAPAAAGAGASAGAAPGDGGRAGDREGRLGAASPPPQGEHGDGGGQAGKRERGSDGDLREGAHKRLTGSDVEIGQQQQQQQQPEEQQQQQQQQQEEQQQEEEEQQQQQPEEEQQQQEEEQQQEPQKQQLLPSKRNGANPKAATGGKRKGSVGRGGKGGSGRGGGKGSAARAADKSLFDCPVSQLSTRAPGVVVAGGISCNVPDPNAAAAAAFALKALGGPSPRNGPLTVSSVLNYGTQVASNSIRRFVTFAFADAKGGHGVLQAEVLVQPQGGLKLLGSRRVPTSALAASASAKAAPAGPLYACGAPGAAGGVACAGAGPNPDAERAATFALRQINAAGAFARGPATFITTTRPYATQVVAGLNYFLTFVVTTPDGHAAVVQAKVYQNLQRQQSLTAWALAPQAALLGATAAPVAPAAPAAKTAPAPAARLPTAAAKAPLFTCPVAGRPGGLFCRPADADATRAAEVALAQINAAKGVTGGPLKLKAVTTYATQVVAGTNYWVDFVAKDAAGADKRIQARVFRPLPVYGGDWKLSEYVVL